MEMKEPNEPGEKKIDGQDETAAVCTTDMESSGHSPAAKQDKSSQQQAYHEYIFHISASAIVGGSFRAFLSRFFGGDCEDGDVNDFLTPLSNRICVTAGGRTMQTGGALFRDMPANFLGCFIMGFISPLDLKKTSRIPWHHQHHPLQQDHVFHTGLGVGLCGCLTTFASWNSQMVVMMVRMVEFAHVAPLHVLRYYSHCELLDFVPLGWYFL